MNLMECVAYISGLEHSSYPLCACPVISELARVASDRATPSQRQALLPFILPLSTSAASYRVQTQRLFHCVEFTLHMMAPAAFAYCGYRDEAASLRRMEPIRDAPSAEQAHQTIRTEFLRAYLTPEKAVLSHTLSSLERVVDAAAKSSTPDGDAFTVLEAVHAAMARIEGTADATLANLLLRQKITLIWELLRLGDAQPLHPSSIRNRQRRLALLASRQALG